MVFPPGAYICFGDAMKRIMPLLVLCLLLTGCVALPATAPAEPMYLALTFDDGPHPVYTEELLDGLKKRKVMATFFLIGNNIEGNEEIVKRMAEEGHLIGSHTYNHVQLNKLSESKAKEEILKGCNKIYETTGVCPSFVRPPFGEWKKNMDFCVTMLPVFWNVDSLDWKLQNTEKIVTDL